MKPRSLRARLALWHAGLLGLTLLTLAALTYLLLLRMLHSRSDAELEGYAEVTAKDIAAELFRASGLKFDFSEKTIGPLVKAALADLEKLDA